MDTWKIRFILSDAPVQFLWAAQGEPVWKATLEEGVLSISMLFTADPRPLILTAAAIPGDEITFVYRPYRLELWVNGILVDEEWPFGNSYLADAIQTEANVPLKFEPAEPAPEEASVLGSFEHAEGWRPGGGVYVGDCMPYSHGGRYHLLYLKDRRRHGSKWGFGAHQWAHISTEDFIHWDIHPMAVKIDDPLEGSVCTGSHIFDNGRHLLYYTIRKSDRSPATIQRSVSVDGYHFRKDPDFRLLLSDRYRGVSARDPKVIRGEDGLLHMFVTTTDLTLNKGCLVHLVSFNGDDWEEQGNVFVREDTHEPECPDYFKIGDYYYLVHDGIYTYSREPFGGWIQPENGVIPCGRVPKGAYWGNRLVFAGFDTDGQYAGTLIFREATQNPDGTLTFLPLDIE